MHLVGILLIGAFVATLFTLCDSRKESTPTSTTYTSLTADQIRLADSILDLRGYPCPPPRRHYERAFSWLVECKDISYSIEGDDGRFTVEIER